MEAFMAWLKSVNDVVWGPGMLVLLVGTGLYLTVGLKFFTFRNFFRGLKNLWAGRSNQSEQGEISPFNALMTALAADIGTGNIVGVSTAIYIGGPGALFWMWVTALVGMATKFSEVLLSVHFREKTPAGNWVGGAMYFIKNGLGPKWMWLGSCFALFGIVACIGTGAMVQGNSIGEAIQANLSIPTWFTAIAVFLLAGAVLIGGVKRIGAVAGKVVPAMAVIYVLISLIVIILHIDQLPRVLAWVVAEKIDGAALAVHAPAEGCGEGEEGQADRHRDAADAGKRGFEGGGGHGGPGEAGGPLAGHKDSETGHGAHDDRINEGIKHTDGSLHQR